MSKNRSGQTPAPSPSRPTQRCPPGIRRPLRARKSTPFSIKSRRSSPAAIAGGRGRLIFALDATMSRQPTWDQACALQADMFREAAAAGGLDIQLVYYRGLAECRASPWVAEPQRLGELMSRIDCRGGQTQIGKVLAHARRESDKAAQDRRPGLCRRRHGGIARRIVCRRRRAWLAQCPGLHVPGRLRSGLRTSLS